MSRGCSEGPPHARGKAGELELSGASLVLTRPDGSRQLAGVLERLRRGEPLAGCKDFEARLLKVVEEYSASCCLTWVGPTTLRYGFWHGEGRDRPDWECRQSVLALSEDQRADLDRLAIK